jgi:hypothetical protein
MKITRIFVYITVTVAMLVVTSCNDWLTEKTPGTSTRDEFFTSGETAKKVVTAAYVPLMWEYGSTYYPEWFIGDVVSDDALKGGQTITDMADVYDMENWKTNTNNTFLLEFYRAQYQGIGRANLALDEIQKIKTTSTFTSNLKNRYIGEAKFLRAMYYFRLARIFGGVALVDYVVDSSNKWEQSRSSRDSTFLFIIHDLKSADSTLWVKSKYDPADLGRATKGAAEAMLMRVNLYRAGFLSQDGNMAEAQKCYTEVKKYGELLKASGEYSLCEKYFDNFTLAGENGKESVFEIQYTEDPQSDYGEGEGFTRGTFTCILQRSRSTQLGGGWGFDKPTQNLYNEFEADDQRRDETILNPTDDQIETPAQEIYLGDRYCNRKYAMYTDGQDGGLYTLSHASRGPLNYKIIRYSDVLLMYAEACCELGNLDEAKNALNEVRSRVGLDTFPYTATIQGKSITFTDNQSDLRIAIRHERRVEFAMEGQRWFDLCRWGVAKSTMDAYIAGETEEVRKESATFIAGKNELFPIPAKEIELSGIQQNPKY